MSRAAVPVVAVAATAWTWDLMHCSEVLNKNFQAFLEHQVNVADAKPEKKIAHAISYMVVKESVKTRKGIQNTALPKNRTCENQHNIMQQH